MIVCDLSVFCEVFARCMFSFSYVLFFFLHYFTFHHVSQVRRFANHMILDFPDLFRVDKSVSCSANVNVGAGETSVFEVAAESAMRLVEGGFAGFLSGII